MQGSSTSGGNLAALHAELAQVRDVVEALRPEALAALAAAEAARDGDAIMSASLALGQIDSIRATLLTKDSGAPLPQRRPRERDQHTPPIVHGTPTAVKERSP